MTKPYLILDCYVDEPACFGVPPFISPYPRYIFGALVDAGIDPGKIDYLTIDNVRATEYHVAHGYSLVLLVGGATVPGKYLGYSIGTVTEIGSIIETNPHLEFVIGGLVAFTLKGEFRDRIHLCTSDIEKFAYELVRGTGDYGERDYHELDRWAVYGAEVVTRHPDFPHLVCEMETYRGCPRRSHCSFCSESIHSNLAFRQEESILQEIDRLIELGISRFRLGRQADIIAYKSSLSDFTSGFPRPEVAPVTRLFLELKKRKDDGRITLLNVDNANPGTIFHYPEESSTIINTIAHAVTPDDTLPLGVESFDDSVIKKNNLKLPGEKIKEAVRIVNEAGGFTSDGFHALLPGINLIHGLPGESPETFKFNYRFLMEMLEEGLLLKRINIRSILPFPGTPAALQQYHVSAKTRNRYEYFRQKIREDIDHPMLLKIYPAGTVLRDVRVEEKHHDHSLGRQLKSYAITVRIPLPLELKKFQDVIVVDHRERSVVGLPHPVIVNQLPQKALELIPGISRKTASDIILQRPFSSFKEIEDLVTHVAPSICRSIKDGF